jgi:ABC-type molybdate transport system substrate-binding protein
VRARNVLPVLALAVVGLGASPAVAQSPSSSPTSKTASAPIVVSKEDNVAAVRSRIDLREGDVAIVYITDAIASGDKVVEHVAVPPEANVGRRRVGHDAWLPATYAAVVVGTSDRPAESQAHLDWLIGPAGQAVRASFGYAPAQ